MPKEWYDYHAADRISDLKRRSFYLKILADKKPYFMRYIYPVQMRKYNTYIKNTKKSALREFGITVDDLMTMPEESLTERQAEFLSYYRSRLPVGVGNCVMNRICRRFEEEFDSYMSKYRSTQGFDHSILKCGKEYTRSQYSAIFKLYQSYMQRLKSYSAFTKYERVDDDEVSTQLDIIQQDFVDSCTKAVPERAVLCDIVVDICYSNNKSKVFAWNMCGQEMVNNLLRMHGGIVSYPTLDENGDIRYAGKRFSIRRKEIQIYE